ncbi:MAG: enoyl-CoA hydratase-related protein [Casimicrobiaceae bacterium]
MDLVTVTDDGPVRTIRMNRPDKKNALTAEMYEAMSAAIEGAKQHPVLRCLLIEGCPSDFCAGNDIADFIKASVHGGTLGAPIIHFLDVLINCDKPLVAAVQGNAVGIGTTMLFHCDYVVASSKARFSAPFVSLGVVPEAASTLIAPRMMGNARAFSLLVMGRPMLADDAKAAGLVNMVVAPEEVDAEATKAAHEIAALPPQGVLVTRRLLRGSCAEILARMHEETTLFQTRLRTEEARTAFEAFLTRKK